MKGNVITEAVNFTNFSENRTIMELQSLYTVSRLHGRI